MKTVTILFSLLLLSACQMPVAPDEDSPYYAIPAGSRLILNRDITVPPNKGGVLIQNGEIMTLSQINQYYAYCDLEMRHPKETAQIIQPDTFNVIKVRRNLWSKASDKPTQVAGLMFVFDEDGRSYTEYETELFLHSPRQPEVYRMACKYFDDAFDAEHLTIKEIRAALGSLVTLELAEASH